MSTATTPPPELPEQPRKRKSRVLRILLWVFGTLLGLVLLLVVAALIILPSDWFREKIRARAVYEIEKASGGRVEIGAFRYDWSSLTFEIAPFVVHGTEPASEAPLFRAESVKVGLKIISAFKRDVDIASLYVEQPKVNLLVDASGTTNIPKPKIQTKSDKDPIEQILELAVGNINLHNGEVHFGEKKMPLDVRGRYLDAKLSYDLNGPSYQGTLGIKEITGTGATPLPVNFGLESRFRLLKNRVEIQQARIAMKESSIELAGAVEDLRDLRVTADVTANGSVAELGPILNLPQPHVGNVNFSGKVQYDAVNLARVKGRITGQHLAVRQDRINLQNISVASDVEFDNNNLKLRDLTVHALDGVFKGSVDLTALQNFKVNGQLNGVSIQSLARVGGMKRADFSGAVNGPVQITGSLAKGSKDLKAGGRFNIVARQGGVPVKGFIDVSYTQRTNAVQLGKSWLTLPNTRLDLTGTLGDQLIVKLESTNLNDFKPVMTLASGKPAEDLPVVIEPGGSALFEGTVTGPIDRAKIAGDLTVTTFRVQKEKVDRFVATVNASPSGAQLSSFALGQDTLRLAGKADVVFQNWKLTDASAVSASVKLEGAQLERLIEQAGQKVPVKGVLSSSIDVSGTVGAPNAILRATIEKPVLYDEPFDRLTAELRYAGSGIEVVNGVLTAGKSRVLLAGTYSHPVNDLKNGALKFNVSTDNWRIEQIRNVSKARPGLEGQVDVKISGLVSVKNAEVFPQSIDGAAAIKALAVDKRAIGDIVLEARTSGQQLTLAVNGNFRGSQITGKGGFQLAGDYPGSGEVSLSPVMISTLQDLLVAAQNKEPLPVDGIIEARMTFSGPAKKPEQMTGRLEIPQFQVSPARRALNAKQRIELSLRNQGPLVVEYDGKAVHVRSAHLVGRDTDIMASGSIFMRERTPVDLKLNGNLNLGILQDFDDEVVSSGKAIVNASVRGSLQDPQLAGRMEFQNASLYMTSFPNGLDALNGTILFDQRRATIEKLNAKTGGGDLQLSGFLGFGGNEIVYRLQARADRVRIRYPEGVSASANATLSLTGSTSRSLLSGVVTILRAGFNPKTDVGGLLASAPTPVTSASSANPFLRNTALDIHVETVPNLQFSTSLTADLQADADLQVRGSAARPVVLGRVVVSQGEVQFFGNKYTIARGEIGFFNPVRIEPVLDLSLETQARGVQVSINFNGTLQKLNVSYRSDPPLQSSEIIALLAVGRAPGSNSSLASSQTVSNSNLLATGTNSLLGQAIANPVSNRLQRFFGVSKLKIDPQLTGLSAVPQARLTIEQQISRDITLTYVSNLAQANQQIIRLEWNLSKAWSVVAVREDNGVFGVDFFFKKRFR